MKVKEIDRTAHVAWSPADQYPILIATGTAAQQLDATFSTSSSLELYGLNLSEPGLDMTCKGSVAIDHRFHSLCWGGSALGVSHDKAGVSGMIVGGCDGGKLFVYSPSKILSGESDAMIFQSCKHTGPVRALDFNPFQTNLLASGASESEIYIWDLLNMSSPMTPGAKSQPADDVTSIAWNRQVQHILASTFSTRCVVWDLRKNEPIIKVSSSTSRMSCKVVAWHPEVATQMCLASEDDVTPYIQLWDLRFAASPLKTMNSLQRGVLSLAWCPQDPDLLLSGGKDHRIVFWNPNSSLPEGEIVCELPTSNQWSFDVAWCPRNPGLISSCSYDGHVSIFSLMGEQQQTGPSSKVAEAFSGIGGNFQPIEVAQTTNLPKVVLKHPPKWLKRPISASFGFGGKLVTYEVPAKQDHFNARVYISQVVTEPDLSGQAKQLENIIVNRNYSEFCGAKIGLSTSTSESEIWSFIQAKFDSDFKAKYLELLGHPMLPPTEVNEANLNGINSSEEIFDSISQSRCKMDEANFVIPNDESVVGQASRFLLGNQLEEAVDICVKNDLISEAILLGIAGGEKLLARAQRAYFTKNESNPLTKFISAILNKNWQNVVDNCSLQSWREGLAGCLVYADINDVSSLCEKMGDRLSLSGDNFLSDAILCYIIAGRLDKIVECWWKSPVDHNQPISLQNLVEKLIILKQAPEQKSTYENEHLIRCFKDIAHYLASQGNLSSALMYTQSIVNNEEDISMLAHRLQRALGIHEKSAAPRLSVGSAPQAAVPSGAPLPTSYQRPRYDSSGSASEVTQPSTARGSMAHRYPPAPAVMNNYNSTPSVPFYPTPVEPSFNTFSSNSFPSYPTANTPQHDANFSYYGVSQYQQHPSQPTSSHPPATFYSDGSQTPAIPDVPQYSSQDLKPGWNDPPSLVGTQPPKQDYITPLAPITHPLYQTDVQRLPEVPNFQHQVPPNYEGYQLPPQQQQQQQQPPVKKVSVQSTPEAPKPLEPIPTEHQILKNVFEELKNNCLAVNTNMQIKRKLEDVSKKLEVLYNKLRENSLSPNTIYSLNQIIQFINQHDYPSALVVHSQMVATVAFSEISGFMPGIKVLIQTAQQANVYLR